MLEIDNLVIRAEASGKAVVRGASLSVRRGEVLALIGESGSGKTTLCLAALGHVRPGLRIDAGGIRFDGTDLLAVSRAELRRLRGRRMAYVAQSAAAGFNPSITVGAQVIEPVLVHRLMPADQAEARARALYRELGLPDPDRIGARYPHQVSGGQLQRLMAAMAMSCGPDLLVLDEPTTALDVTTQIGVLKAFKDALARAGAAALYVSHDLAVVVQVADRILVLRDGEVQEEGETQAILTRPAAPYTRQLLEACNRWVPGRRSPAARRAEAAPLVELRGITAGYGRADGGGPAVVAARDVDLTIPRSGVVGVIGESGSGKSTLARVISGLLPPAAGSVLLDGRPLAPSAAQRTKDELRRVQIVFQSPDVALNPAQSVGFLIGRPLRYFHGLGRRAAAMRVGELPELVHLPPEFAARYPQELSGGQKQRVNLARALAADPDLILCDEITSALDTLIAGSVINLLRDLRARRGLGFLFISHDVSTVANFADEVAVMFRGEIVERGPADRVLGRPEHPYTQVLISSVPQLRTDWLEGAIERRERVLERAGGIELAD